MRNFQILFFVIKTIIRKILIIVVTQRGVLNFFCLSVSNYDLLKNALIDTKIFKKMILDFEFLRSRHLDNSDVDMRQ